MKTFDYRQAIRDARVVVASLVADVQTNMHRDSECAHIAEDKARKRALTLIVEVLAPAHRDGMTNEEKAEVVQRLRGIAQLALSTDVLEFDRHCA